MKFILAQKNVRGETVGYYIETHSKCNNGMCGQVIANITPDIAKKYDNEYDARNARIELNDKCDLNLHVEPYYSKSDLIENKEDFVTMIRILETYSPEDIAEAITAHMSLENRVKIIMELSKYNANMQRIH